MSGEDSLLPADEFDSLFSSNFGEISFETEFESKGVLEDLIFGPENRHFTALDEEAASFVIDAFDGREDKDENSALIKCANCDDTFTSDAFKSHVCRFNENKQLIQYEFVQDRKEESEFQKCHRNCMSILNDNQALIKKLLSDRNETEAAIKDGKARQSNYQCFVCNRKFVHESGLYRHYDKHIGEIIPQSITVQKSNRLHSVILCSFCGETFTFEQSAWKHCFENHFEIKDNEMYIVMSPRELAEDPMNEGDNATEPAPKRLKTNSPSNEIRIKLSTRDPPVQEFLRTIYVSKLYNCDFCDSAFANSKSLLHHVSKHEPTSFFSCKCCNLQGLSLKDILIHRHEECMIYRDVRHAIKEIPRVWVCNVCDEEFRGIEQLIIHRHTCFHFFPRMEHRNDQLVFSCEFCSTLFENAVQLVEHLTEKHLKRPRSTVHPETSTRIQQSPSNARKGGGHQTSTRPRQYLCEVCGKSYTQSSHLWQHLRFHQGVKPFLCPHESCGRRFTIRPDLNDHIRKCHTGERPYECATCGKRFLTGSVYYQHRLIHRGERRYGCDECGKRFYRADALKNHQRIHSGEKPYKCWVEGCFKSFRQRGDRDKHVKARHKDAPPPTTSPPKKMKVLSFGRGRTRNNTSLYSSRPEQPIDFNLTLNPGPSCRPLDIAPAASGQN